MRARYPDQEGFVEREGVKIFYEVFGEGDPTVILLPTWSIVHSRSWKAQIPYLARHCRVITFDGRGNGRSSRPESAEAYSDREFAADALAVMDATATGQAVLVSVSLGAFWALLLAAEHPKRVTGAVFVGPALPLGLSNPLRMLYTFNDVLDTDEGWAKYNSHFWLKDYRGFLDFFMAQLFTEPHSTKQIEDALGWGLETTPEVLTATQNAGFTFSVNVQTVKDFIDRVRCPVLVIHGDEDAIIPHEIGARLAEHTVTEVLKERGERIHPASAHLANESRHIESESAEHDLHCFQAYRRMDEILIANYMLFHDVVNDEPYDLWIGDEAWELDYFLHENPEEKRAAYVWLTDFVGWLPMPDGGTHEALLTSDYNAEMIEHIERFPRLRDRAIFVGTPEDIVPDTFGANLPAIRAWTEQHYDFAGYITGFDPAAFADREAIRAQLGYRPDEKVCIVAVGGSGVGFHLLRRVMAAFPEAKRRVPELRMIVVAGPRIEPQSLPTVEGLEVRAYVYELYRHLAVCDLAVVQGGLTTAMELTANKRPFLYFPLRHHFEQSFHVRHRLERYQAGRCMDFEQATPEVIAAAIAQEIGREVVYRDVENDGAARAAARIAELI